MDEHSYKHLAWKCRRGMLELDLLFTRFYQEQFLQLPPQKKAIFAELLDEDDPVLASWLLGSAQPANPAYINLINRIKR